MAISQNQIVDYLNKKVGYGVAKTDLYTAKQPYNESIASPLLVPGASVLQQDFAIPNVSSAPSANTVLNGSTIVSVYNTSTSAVVQGTALSESETNETWSTGITNWIPPSFGSGYQLKIYAGPPGATVAQVANFTNLPVAGSGASDSWFFDYQAGVLNFADTIVPTAAANVSNVVYFMGAAYTGTLGITNYANLSVTGNLTSVNGNIVLTNGNLYAQNLYGTFQGSLGSMVSATSANVASYDTVTPVSSNQSYYLELATQATSGNSITGVNSALNYNPSTGALNAGTVIASTVNAATIGNAGAVFSGASETLTGTLIAATVNAATIGNAGAVFSGASETLTGTLIASTVNAATIGNTGAVFTGASETLSGTLFASTVNAATIGNAGAVFSGASETLTGTLIATTLNAATIGNTGAVFTGASETLSGTLIASTVNAATIGNAGATFSGASETLSGTLIAATLNAATIGNTGATLTGTNVNGVYVLASTGLSTANAVITGGNIAGTPIGTGVASTGAFTTLSASGQTQITNTTNATGLSTGSFYTLGGAAISQDLWVGGTIYANTLQTVQTQILSVNEPLLYLTGTNPYPYNYDIGFYSHFVGGAANLYSHSGFVRNYLDGDWYLFSNVPEPSGNVINLASTNLIYDALKLGSLLAMNTTPSTSTTTGALQVAGGAGIAGALNVGSTVIASGNIVAGSGTTSSSTTTGALVVAGSGGAGIGGALNVGGVVQFTNATQNTGASTGALQVTGGAYIGGNLWVGGNINLTSSTVINSPTGQFTGNAAGFGALYAGITAGYVYQPQTVIQASTNFNGYAQVNNQNISSGTSASTDFVATMDTGTAGTGYIDMGINSSGYNGATNGQTLSYAGDGYLYVQANATGSLGNLMLGTAATTGNIFFVAGGLNTNNQVMTITTANTVVVTSSVAATNTSSGALQVQGGVGVTGAVYAGSIQNTPIGSTTASTGNFTTLNATTSVTTATLNAATIGNVGASGQFGTIIASTLNAAIIGNTGATITGASATLSGTLIASTVNAATIGNTGAVFTGANETLTGTLIASTVNAATIGNTGANGQFGTIIASTVNAATIGNTGATITGASATLSGTLIASTVNAATIGNVGASGQFGTIIASTLNAATIGNTGATVTGTNVNGVYVLASTGLSTANAVITGGSINGTTIGATNASTGNFTTLNATTSVTTATVNAATIGNTGANVNGTGTYLTALTATNVNGTVNTANVSYYKVVQAVTNNQTYYLGFANATSGNSTFNTTTTVNVNPSTGTIYASAFVGSGAGLTNLSIGSITGTYPTANASIYTGVTNNTSGSTFYPILSGQSSTGNVQAQVNGGLSYVPNTGTLSATAFSGSGTSYIQTLQVNGTFTGCGTVAATSGASSTSTSTGALQVTGGAGITGNLYVGSTGVFGSVLNYIPANAPIQVGLNINNYSQVSIQNANNGNNASSDIAAVANNGSDNDTYVDMGIVGSGYSQAAYNLYNPNDGYLIVAGNTTTGGGNLILNTYQKNDIIFATGGTTKQFEVARITSGNTLVVKSTNTNSLTANTGALQVWGGASISGNVYNGASLVQVAGAQFNTGRASAGTTGATNINALIMQGVNDSTLIYAKPLTAYDAVIIGGNGASTSFAQGAKLVVNSTDSMMIPVGTSSQRPGSSGGTDTTGMLRYSSTVGSIEWFNGTSWQSATTSFTVIQDQQFTGTGSQTVFTLSSSQTTASCIVSINGVVQIPTLAYSVSGTSLTFTEAPQSTDVIDVRMLTTTSTVAQLYDTSGYNTVNTITGTGITFTTGTSSLQTQYTINTTGAIASTVANVTIATASTPTTVDSFFANTYSTAKYILTSTLGSVKEATEVLVISNGTVANVVVYGTINTAGNSLTTWSAVMSGNIVQLQGTTTNNSTVIRMTKQYNAV